MDGLSPEFIGEAGTQETAHSLSQKHEGLRDVHLGRLVADQSPLY